MTLPPPGGLLLALTASAAASVFFSLSHATLVAVNARRARHLARATRHTARRVAFLLDRAYLPGLVLLAKHLSNALLVAFAALLGGRWADQPGVVLGAVLAGFLIFAVDAAAQHFTARRTPERTLIELSAALRLLLSLGRPLRRLAPLRRLRALLAPRARPAADTAGARDEGLRADVAAALDAVSIDHWMLPRSQMEVMDLDAPLQDTRQQLFSTRHDYLPVVAGGPDEVTGVLRVLPALQQLQRTELNAETLRRLTREPYYVPAGTGLLTQLRQFQEKCRRVGLVVDEYGELVGLITLADLLEAVVGELTRDAAGAAEYTRSADGGWAVEGRIPVRELNRRLGFKLPEDGPKTLNGLILEQLEALPEAGVSLKIAEHPVEIVQTQDRAVKVARIYPAVPPPAAREI